VHNGDVVIVGTAGLGNIDNFVGLHKVCHENNVWLHVLG